MLIGRNLREGQLLQKKRGNGRTICGNLQKISRNFPVDFSKVLKFYRINASFSGLEFGNEGLRPFQAVATST
jgi:hypothetical protein